MCPDLAPGKSSPAGECGSGPSGPSVPVAARPAALGKRPQSSGRCRLAARRGSCRKERLALPSAQRRQPPARRVRGSEALVPRLRVPPARVLAARSLAGLCGEARGEPAGLVSRPLPPAQPSCWPRAFEGRLKGPGCGGEGAQRLGWAAAGGELGAGAGGCPSAAPRGFPRAPLECLQQQDGPSRALPLAAPLANREAAEQEPGSGWPRRALRPFPPSSWSGKRGAALLSPDTPAAAAPLPQLRPRAFLAGRLLRDTLPPVPREHPPLGPAERGWSLRQDKRLSVPPDSSLELVVFPAQPLASLDGLVRARWGWQWRA